MTPADTSAAADVAEPPVSRLFFALWPDAALAREMHATGALLHARWGGRRVTAANLHVTLAFLGQQPTARIAALRDMAAALKAPVFELSLDVVGCWRHNRVAWLGCATLPSAAASLAAALADGLRSVGIEPERRPFVPHVTLLRKAVCDGRPLQIPPSRWSVRSFALMRSQLDAAGARYERLGAWPLG